MTQNNWPQDSSAIPAEPQQADLRQASTFPPAPRGGTDDASANSGGSKAAATKEQAGELTRQAADSAQDVAETAKAEVANVAAEVKTNARDLLDQARSDLTEQAGTQQQKVAEGLRSVSTELQSMADASDQPGVATDLVRQAAERSSAVASWLDARDPGSLLTEVKSFARQRPGTFLMLAAGAGILAGRLSRSLSAGAPESPGSATDGAAAGAPAAGGAPINRVPDTGTAVPPPPVQLPAPETTTAGFHGTYPPNPLDGNGRATDAWEGDAQADQYLTEPVAPLRDDPFEGGRR